MSSTATARELAYAQAIFPHAPKDRLIDVLAFAQRAITLADTEHETLRLRVSELEGLVWHLNHERWRAQ